MLHPKNPNEMPDLEVTQEELKQLIAFAGIMAIGIHYGVDPTTSINELPEDIENNGGMLGLMMNTVRASDAVGELLSRIIERNENAEKAKIDQTAEMLLKSAFDEGER